MTTERKPSITPDEVRQGWTALDEVKVWTTADNMAADERVEKFARGYSAKSSMSYEDAKHVGYQLEAQNHPGAHFRAVMDAAAEHEEHRASIDRMNESAERARAHERQRHEQVDSVSWQCDSDDPAVQFQALRDATERMNRDARERHAAQQRHPSGRESYMPMPKRSPFAGGRVSRVVDLAILAALIVGSVAVVFVVGSVIVFMVSAALGMS